MAAVKFRGAIAFLLFMSCWLEIFVTAYPSTTKDDSNVKRRLNPSKIDQSKQQNKLQDLSALPTYFQTMTNSDSASQTSKDIFCPDDLELLSDLDMC